MATQLDPGQAIKRSFDDPTQSFKVSSLTGTLVPAAYDYIALTYVPSGNGAGQIQTATYKTGGSSGTTVATLTLTYDASNNVSTITKT